LAIAAVAVAAAPFLRIGQFYLLPERQQGIGTEFQTVMDSIAAGCLLAGFREEIWSRRWYRWFLESRLFLVVPVVAALAIWAQPRSRFSMLIGGTALNIAIALIIDRCVRHPQDVVGRVLNWRPVAFVGVLSYSLYLWQQPFLNRNVAAATTSFPLNLLLAAAAATGSYYWIGRPFLRLGKRFRHAPPRPASESRPAVAGV
ncbi:MAG: hypothetical protein HYZ57_13605, partial [Acidobacteria bacterium]|nr:hypothetical protein [Acidobacteriota bacterium]